ncbi:DUF6705 family protein [Chryseobacterium sp. Hurlbut01]|jgi:hypothetical protein|uniref:DUF6705 family protein n=1 Tax=Chryseobacterium sp. Hurlbut01 TaxID=1681828 RepID=UPI00067B0B99|nr:DUF6705 family protein [Chryseobacterium sp. Hurlbut01]KNB62984.1 hypothetical protein AC804_02890 [Chryseobacterium sp. Hurlbut01]
MKNILLSLLIGITVSCNAQIYPLRTYQEIPENSYLKDTNNELPTYEGVWTATWNNKIIYVTLKKITYKYESYLKEYRDVLIGKFKVTDSNGVILFDNTNLSDNESKIVGTFFRKSDNKYYLVYSDKDLCGRSGNILINFTDATKTKLQWQYSQDENFIEPDCFYYNYAPQDYPQPLPKNIVLTKQ